MFSKDVYWHGGRIGCFLAALSPSHNLYSFDRSSFFDKEINSSCSTEN